MLHSNARRFALSVVPLLTLMGCKEDKVSAEQVSSRTTAITTDAVISTVSAIEAVSGGETWASVSASLDAWNSAFASLPSLTPTMSVAPLQRLRARSSAGTQGALTCAPEDPNCVESAAGPDQFAAELSEFLRTRVFTEENLESGDEGSATFLLHGASFCGTISECSFSSCDPNDATCTPQYQCVEVPDQGCIEFIDKAEIRVRATLVDPDGVDLELLIGPAQVDPLLFELRPKSVAVELDLGAAKAAVEHIARAASAEQPELPRVMLGRLRASIAVNGEKDVTILGSILEPVDVEVDGTYGLDVFKAAAADPLTSLHVQGLLGKLAYSMAANAVDIEMPYAEMTANAASEGRVAFHLAGLSYGVELSEGAKTLTINNIGLGNEPSTFSKGGSPLVQVDLNAAAGRHFALGIGPDRATGSAFFGVTPEFDLSAAFHLAQIAADFPEIESHFLNETYRVRLWGAGEASVLPLPGNGVDIPGALKVVLGVLQISSTAADAPVTVEAGQCLMARALLPEGAHPILGHFVASACP